MKKVKKQKTYLQKYQTYFNKKVAAVCAMTLTVSSLLSPLATSANNNSNPVYISPVSETQTIGDEYVNVELSYEDIEESQLNVELNIQTNFKDQLELEVPSEETPELEVPSEETPEPEVPSEEKPESEVPSEEKPESEVPSEEKPESEVPSEEKPESEVPSEEKPESEVPSEEKPESEVPSEEKPESEVPSEEKPGSEVRSEETPKTEVEVNLESDIEALLESSEPIVNLKNIDYRIAGFLNTNFSFQSIVKKLSNSFSFLTNNTENKEQTSAFVLEIPIHSSFTLNKDSFEIVGKDGETVTPSQIELNKNNVKLIFDKFNQIPEELKVSFILERSQDIVSGQVIVNKRATIQYKTNDEQVHVLEIPEINVNLYETSQFLGLPTLKTTDSNQTNECADKTGDYAIQIDENRKLCIDKTVAGPDNGAYTITLDTTGYIQQQEVVADTDIVLVVDTSSSMQQEISNLRTYIDEFITTMLGNNTTESPDAIQIAVVNYNSSAKNYFKTENISTTGFISQYTNTAKSSIAKLPIATGTNTQDGINEAVSVLNSGRANVNKYVILFTDGVPSRNSISKSEIKSYFSNNKNNFTAAQVEYYSQFKGPLSNGTSKIDLGNITYSGSGVSGGSVNEKTYTYNYATLTPLDVTFYSIGYFEGIGIPTGQTNNSNYTNITRFLHSIQNVEKDLTSYQSKYFTDDIDKLGQFYEDIAQKIQSDITNLLSNVYITDIVPKYLDIVDDSFTSTIHGVVPTVTPDNTGDHEKTITWNFPSLSASGVKVSFKVVPNNYYFGAVNDSELSEKIGINGVYTNDSATITGKELLTDAIYPRPHVDIAPVQGGIKVVKEVKKGNTVYNTTDKFSVNIMGPSPLGFEVVGNGSQEVSFYLRDSKTDISYNKDYSKNYLMAGSYSVDEIVPANYERTNLNVQYCDSTYTTCRNVKEDGSSFTSSDTFDLSINNHKYIKIIVTNELVNENYWYDKDNEPNKFIYTKPNAGESTNPTEE